MAGDQVAVQDVPGGGDEAAAVTHAVEGVCVHLEVTLTVCFGGEGGQADETDERTLTCGQTTNQTTSGRGQGHYSDINLQ